MKILDNLKITLSNSDEKLVLNCENLLNNLVTQETKVLLNLSYNTAIYLDSLKLDLNTIIAGFLLGFFRKNIISEEDILSNSNNEVLNILSSLKKVENTEHTSIETEAENIRNMFVAMAKDMRVIIVKLADVRESLININLLSETEKKLLLTEVKDIYSPLAERLGLNSLKGDLEDNLFKLTKPAEYKELSILMSKSLASRTDEINKIKSQLETMLKDLGINGIVYGREKRIASVYKKITNKTNSLDNIYDLIALRIIVDNVEQCYTVLGKIHTMFVPLNNRFKDYIALPKQNGYQSLHTTVLNSNNEPFEIQIRTFEMHEYAEYGVAAHWVYKEGGKSSNFDKKFGWLRKMMEESKDLTNEEFIDVLKTDIFSGQIFVQSPLGKVISFPEGATPIDFAFAIHSNIGEHCVGAKVNGKMCPLTSKLNNGDTVEIITSSQSKGPSRDWLNYVVSTGARSKIKAYFKREMKEENIKKGKVMLEQSAKNKALQLHKLLQDDCLEPLYKKYRFSSLDEVYASLGYGGVTTSQVLNKLLDTYNKLHSSEIDETMQTNDEQVLFSSKNDSDAIVVRGENNMLTRFARCCNAIPGDEIIGFVSRGRGVTIHRADCVNVPFLDKDRLIKCTWQESKVSSFLASIRIIAVNSTGTLSEISQVIANNKVNIQSIESKNFSKDKTYIDLIVTLNKKEQLPILTNSLKKCKSVIDVFRSSSKE